jgi:hypothetical protein
MAESNGLSALNVQTNCNSEYYSSVNCLNSIDLGSQLREAHLEISSLQYINKLLYKELNNGASMNTMGKWTRSTTTSQISTPNCDHHSFGKPETLQPSQLVSTTNRFSILAKLPENGATPSESKETIDGLSHYHSYKRKQQQKRKYIRNKANNHHVRTSTQQPNDYQIPWHEPKDQVNIEKEANLTSRKHRSNSQMNTNTNISVSAKVNHKDHNTTHPNHSEW